MCISAVKRSVKRPGHGEPAAGVEEDGDGVGYGGELDAFDRAGVGAG